VRRSRVTMKAAELSDHFSDHLVRVNVEGVWTDILLVRPDRRTPAYSHLSETGWISQLPEDSEVKQRRAIVHSMLPLLKSNVNW